MAETVNFNEKVVSFQRLFRPVGRWQRSAFGFEYIQLGTRAFFTFSSDPNYGTSFEHYYMYGRLTNLPWKGSRAHHITCKEWYKNTRQERSIVVTEESPLSRLIPFLDTYAQHVHVTEKL